MNGIQSIRASRSDRAREAPLVAQVDGKWVDVETTWTGPIITVPPGTDLQPKPKIKLLKP